MPLAYSVKNPLQKVLTGLSRSRNVLGIDITDEYLNVALVKPSSVKGEVQFIQSIAIKGMSDDDIAKALNDTLRNIKPRTTRAVLTIPSSLAITKTLQVPSISDGEIRDILNLQAGRHTPYSREEIIVDYINLGQFQDTYTKVLVVMVTREAVNKKLGILERVGLRASKVVFAADGIGKMCSNILKPADDVPQAVLNVDAESTDFNIFNDKGLISIRSIPVGMRQLAEDKEKGLGRLIEELKMSFESYQAEDISKNPNAIYVTGSSLILPEMNRALKEALKMETRSLVFTDFVNVEKTYQSVIKEQATVSFLPVVAACAVSEELAVDLISEEERIRRKFEEKGRKLITTGVLSMVIFIQICLILLLRIYYAETYLRRLSDRFEVKLEEANRLGAISERTRVVRKYLTGKGNAIKVLAKLYELLPDEIYLKDVKLGQDGSISIKGTSESMSRIFAFVTELENDDLFKGVKTEFTESRREKKKDVSDFGIVMTME